MAGAPRPGFVPVDLGAGVLAGFTTRAGGVSPAPWSSLDLGLGVGDDPSRVRENRRLVAGLVGVPVGWATQVHGTRVLAVDPEKFTPGTDSVGEADALVAPSGQGVAVLVADCVPVLLADAEAGLVGTAHAGRRGVQGNVVGAVVAALVARGASAGRLRAAVGPSVCGRCYEVPPVMRAEVAAAAPWAWAVTRQGTSALDLPAAVAGQLESAGVRDVQTLGVCTMEDSRFYSHRGESGATGRFAGVVAHLGTGANTRLGTRRAP